MKSLPGLLLRIAMRIVQGLPILFAVVTVMFLASLVLANYYLAGMKQELTPLVTQQLEQVLGRDVHLGTVKMTGDTVVISNAAIAKGKTFAEGSMFSVPRITARLNLLPLLLRRGKDPVRAISQVTLTKPTVVVNRSRQGAWDIQDILDRVNGRKAKSQLNAQIIVDEGQVRYRDERGFGDKPASIHKDLTNVSLRMTPTGGSNYQFDAAASDAPLGMGRIQAAGHYSAATARVNVTANNVAMAEVARYLPKKLPITFEDSTAAVRLSALFKNLPNPARAGEMPMTALTAEVDLKGVGIRLDEMSAPIIATSGRLRLVHDAGQYPRGSRLDLIDVRAHAGTLPMRFAGSIGDINLFDLAHVNPRVNVTMTTNARDGAMISRLFPRTTWLEQLHLAGPVAMRLQATGRSRNLKIDGKIDARTMRIAEVEGDHAQATFTLRPAAGGKTPTITATAQVKRAVMGDARLAELKVSAQSSTPWRKLDDDFNMHGTADVRRIRLPWTTAEQVATNFDATGKRVTLHDLRTTIFGGKIAGTVSLPIFSSTPADDVLTATADYRGMDLAQVARALHISHLSGSGNGSLNLVIAGDGSITLSTQLTDAALQYKTWHASSLRADIHSITRDGSTAITLPTVTAKTDHGVFTVTDGSYQLTSANPADGVLALPLHGSEIVLHRFSDDLQGNATLQGAVSGSLNAPTLTGTVNAADGSAQGRKFAQGQSDVTVTKDTLRLKNLELSRPGISVRIPGGEDGFDPRNGDFRNVPAYITADGAPVREVLALFNVHAPWPVDGGVHGTAELRLTEHGISLTGDTTVPQAIVHIPTAKGSYPLHADAVGLKFDLLGRDMQVRELTVRRGDTTVTATGKVNVPENAPAVADLDFHSTAADLANLPQDLFGIPVQLSGPATIQGTLDGTLNGTGTNPMTVSAKVDATQLAIEGIPAGTGNVELQYQYRPSDAVLTIAHGQVTNPGFTATSSGAYRLGKGVFDHVALTVRQIDLAAIRQMIAGSQGEGRAALLIGMLQQSLPAQLHGQGTLHVHADGAFRKPDMTVSADLTDSAVGSTPLPNLRARLSSRTEEGRFGLYVDEMQATDAAGKELAHVDGMITHAGQLHLRYAMQDITMAQVRPWAGQLPIDGHLTLAGAIRGTWKAPVVDGKLDVAQPVISGRPLHRVEAGLKYAGGSLTVSDGRVWVNAGSQPLSLHGTLPFGKRDDRALSLQAALPKQSLAILQTLIPGMPEASGTIEGDMTIAGTAAAPRIADGHFAIAGSATLPPMDPAYPNRVDNLQLDLRVTSDKTQSRVSINRLSATLDRLEKGTRPDGYQPGFVAAEGSIGIGNQDFSTPDRWQWDIYAKADSVPLAQALFLVPRVSGNLHLHTQNGVPTLQGVLMAKNVKIKTPKIEGMQAAHWGPFDFNPHLSIVLQVGEGVKLAKSIVRLPLQVTPLPWPESTSAAIDRNDPAFDYNAMMLNPDTAAELPGTWGVVTGTLGDPRLYARFEVNKKKVAFPFSLFSSIRKAKGHVTYSLGEGPRITMGIPDFTAPATVTAAEKPAVRPL